MTAVIIVALVGVPTLWLLARAADIADAIHDRRRGSHENPHCANCGDWRGGQPGHETSECTWRGVS